MKSVIQKVQCVKIDKYYFRNSKGRLFKYSQFCRRKNCKTESSYNYENLKPKYCFKHKKEDMVNVKRGHKLCLKCRSTYKTKCTSQNVNIRLKTIKSIQTKKGGACNKKCNKKKFRGNGLKILQ